MNTATPATAGPAAGPPTRDAVERRVRPLLARHTKALDRADTIQKDATEPLIDAVRLAYSEGHANEQELTKLTGLPRSTISVWLGKFGWAGNGSAPVYKLAPEPEQPRRRQPPVTDQHAKPILTALAKRNTARDKAKTLRAQASAPLRDAVRELHDQGVRESVLHEITGVPRKTLRVWFGLQNWSH